MKILLLLCLVSLLFSKNLYFINASPQPDFIAQYPVEITKLENSSLKLIQKITGEKTVTEFVRIYHDLNKVIILENDMYGRISKEKEKKLHILDYNKSIAPQILPLSDPKYSYISSSLFRTTGNHLIQGVKLRRKSQSLLLGADIDNLSVENIDVNNYKYSILSGIPGGAVAGGDYLSLYAKEDGSLVIPVTSDISKRPVFPYKLPKIWKQKKKDRIVAFINNDKLLVLSSIKSRNRDERGIGSTPFYILNKETNKWHKHDFKGGSTAIRSFGNYWLAGEVKEKKGKRANQFRRGIRKKETRTGSPVKWRLDEYNDFAPGILFCYNADTKKYYEILTNDADSEVLLIDNGIVYYKIYDEIYKAEIGENEISKGELLVKDDIVPDIHWAFISDL